MIKYPVPWIYSWSCGEPGIPMEPAEPQPGETDTQMRARLRPAADRPTWANIPFHRHTAECIWKDVSLQATTGLVGLPMRKCQFGGVQDLRYQAPE